MPIKRGDLVRKNDQTGYVLNAKKDGTIAVGLGNGLYETWPVGECSVISEQEIQQGLDELDDAAQCYILARRLVEKAGGKEQAKGIIDTLDLVEEVNEANAQDT